MKGARVFVDTNILVYAYDSSAGEKHKKAAEMVEEFWQSGNGAVSTQVLQEFYVTVTGKLGKPVDTKIAKSIIKDLLKWKTVIIQGETILEAVDIAVRHKYSFWDAMIVASAIECEAKTILTEDLSHGEKIRGIVINNPFKP